MISTWLRPLGLLPTLMFVSPSGLYAETLVQDFESFSSTVDFPAGTNTFPPSGPGMVGFTVHPAQNVNLAGVRDGGLAGGVAQKELLIAGHAIEFQTDDTVEVIFRFSHPNGKEYVVFNNTATQPNHFSSPFGINLSSAIQNELGIPVEGRYLLYRVSELVDEQSYEVSIQFNPTYLLANPGLRIESVHVVNDGTALFYVDDFRIRNVPEPVSISILLVGLLLGAGSRQLYLAGRSQHK